MHELHPHADLTVDAFSAVNRDDVAMTDSGQQTALVNHGGGVRLIVPFLASQDFQRDLAIEPAVRGSIHIAEAAVSDVFDDPERTPELSRRVGSRGADKV